MLTDQQRATFRDQGVLRLPGFLPPALGATALSSVLAHFQQLGLWSESWCADRFPRARWPNSGVKLSPLKRAPGFAQMITPELLEAVGDLLGERTRTQVLDCPQLLMSLPNAPSWEVPSSLWHVDVPRLPTDDLPGVQLFTFLDRVAPQGGGTLVVAGSHRLVKLGRRIRSKDVKRKLAQKPFFRELMSSDASNRAAVLQASNQVEGVDVQVVELHGEPGDVYLTDLRVLHTVAPNALTAPRIMLTQRFVVEAAHSILYPPGDT